MVEMTTENDDTNPFRVRPRRGGFAEPQIVFLDSFAHRTQELLASCNPNSPSNPHPLPSSFFPSLGNERLVHTEFSFWFWTRINQEHTASKGGPTTMSHSYTICAQSLLLHSVDDE